MSKTEQPETFDFFLRANTHLPYPKVGLKNCNDKADEEDDEEEEEGAEDVQGEEDRPQESSQPESVNKAADAPELPPSM